MKIDITLFVQMINFLVCYGVLSRYFFRPALDELASDAREKDALETRLQQAQSILDTQKAELAFFWQGINEQAGQIKPSIVPGVQAVDRQRTSLLIPVVTSIDVADEVEQVKNILIRMVSHVR